MKVRRSRSSMRLANDQRSRKLAIEAMAAIFTSKLTRIVFSEPNAFRPRELL